MSSEVDPLEPSPGQMPVTQDPLQELGAEPDPTVGDSFGFGTELADGTTRRFPDAHVQVDRVSSMISGGIIGTILCTIALTISLLGELPSDYRWLPLVPAGVLVSFFVFRALAWPQIAHRHRSWRLSTLAIHLTQGVIWRTTTSVPRTRVQHTDVGQGPLQRRYGIATLSIHTAGSDQAQVNLSGLNYEDALAVRDFLILREPVSSGSIPTKDPETVEPSSPIRDEPGNFTSDD